MAGLRALLLCVAVSIVSGRTLLQITPEQNYNPVTVTVTSAPYDIISTPITPVAPYSQAAYQCNVTGDSRYPPYATGTYPLKVIVPVGQRVRVIFANGNLNGATVTQQGEPGVIVQQGGAVIVQQSGYASPIIQPVGSPIVQQTAPTAAYVVQQTPTIVQQHPTYQHAPPVYYDPPPTETHPPPTETHPPPVETHPPPVETHPPPVETHPPPVETHPPPVETHPPPVETHPPPTETPPPVTKKPTYTPPPKKHVDTPPPTEKAKKDHSWTPAPSKWSGGDWSSWTSDWTSWAGRRLQQDTVPGGPNNGIVEYVALASSNTVPGFVVPNTQFGVPYVEFTASAEVKGQTASFKGVLEAAQVVGGVPLYPFRPNKAQSPECQVNVEFVVQ